MLYYCIVDDIEKDRNDSDVQTTFHNQQDFSPDFDNSSNTARTSSTSNGAVINYLNKVEINERLGHLDKVSIYLLFVLPCYA